MTDQVVGPHSLPQAPDSGPSSRARLLLRLDHRRRRGIPLTQSQVAALLGIRQQTVSRIERRALSKIRRALQRSSP